MYLALSSGAVGIKSSSFEESVRVAQSAGFDGLELNLHLVRTIGADAARTALSDANLKPAGFGLSVDFRGATAPTDDAMAQLEEEAELAASLGTDRCFTWIMPGSNERTFEENFSFHVERLRPIAQVLANRGVRLGLEFVGPKTLRDRFAHPFIFDLRGMLELAAEVGPNAGLLVDAFHWYCTGSDEETLAATPADKIVYVHINDAREGRGPDEQIDNERALPAETGVIDAARFLTALRKTGYAGPLAAEPFLDLSGMESDEARAKLIAEAGRRFMATGD
jgi:sugar phosphate isomerase/epimerase